jgi:hypothetical protein
MRGFASRRRPLHRPRPTALRPARAVGFALAGVILATALALAAPPAARGQSAATVGPGETTTVDGVSVVNASGQPVARCRVMPGARVTLAIVGGQAVPPSEAPAPPPAPPQAQPPFPQPPMALARAGAGGLAEDEPVLRWAIAAATAFGVFLLGSALLIRQRRQP